MIFTLPGGFSLSLSLTMLAIVGVIAVVAIAAGYIMWSRSGSVVVGGSNDQAEGFGSTSPGTLTQLSATHVPTEEDEESGGSGGGSGGSGDIDANGVQGIQAATDNMTQDYSPV
jgi:hypothetical protein